MTTRKFAWILLATAAALAVLAPVRRAYAQDARAAKKVEEMNRLAMEDYDLLEFESAKKQLNETLLFVKKNKLDAHPAAARTHLFLGIVYGGGLNDAGQAVVEFSSALQIDPKVQIDAAYRSPELQKLFDQAKATVSSTPTKPPEGPTDPVEPDDGVDDSEVKGLVHTPIDQVFAGEPIAVKAKVGADVRAKQIVLYYRSQGEADFTPVAMKNTKGVTYQAEVPAAAVKGDSLHYYIEAKNAQGRTNASNGNSGSPNIVMIAQRPKPSAGGGGGGGGGGPREVLDDEDPLARGGGGGGKGIVDDPNGTTTVRRPARKARPTIFFAVMGGTGAGYVTGTTESFPTPVNPGFAPAPFHVQPQLGYIVTPQVIVSAVGRIGFPVGANVQGHSRLAPAGVLRVTYMLGKSGNGLFFHGDAGGGFIRQTVTLQGGPHDGETDTYATGPLLVGGGAGYRKTLGGPLQFVAEVSALVGIPVVDTIALANPEFGFNIDGTIGIAFAF